MSAPTKPATRFRFGEFQVDLRTGELFTDGRKSTLSEKPLQLLTALLERPNELVTREELKRRLWRSDTFVDFDLSLNKAMNRLREILQDSADQPRYIETLPRRGYRFIAPADWAESDTEEAQPTLSPSRGDRVGRRFPLKLAVGIALGVAAVLILALAGSRGGPQRLASPKVKQLTTNSREAPIRTGAISPDGKWVAFSDLTGLHIKNVETGETRAVPMPNGLGDHRVDWQVVTWFPDGTRILANIAPLDDVCLYCEHFSAWVISATGDMCISQAYNANR